MAPKSKNALHVTACCTPNSCKHQASNTDQQVVKFTWCNTQKNQHDNNLKQDGQDNDPNPNQDGNDKQDDDNKQDDGQPDKQDDHEQDEVELQAEKKGCGVEKGPLTRVCTLNRTPSPLLAPHWHNFSRKTALDQPYDDLAVPNPPKLKYVPVHSFSFEFYL